MGDCVPDWEEMCGATEIGITLDSLEHLLKEKWENVELSSDIANLQSISGHVSNQSPLGDLANTGVRAMNLEPTSESTSACMWRTENSATVTLSEPPILVFTTGVKKSGDGSCSIQTSQTDEMVSWLQYPLENFLEKEYCGIPRKHPGCGGLPPKDGASGRISFDFPQNGTGFPRTKQMAELKGADVDAGLEPEAGFEGEKGVLPRVRCVQPVVPKGVGLGCTGNVLALGVDPTRKPNPCATGMSSTPVIDTSSGPPSMLNFPLFSRPAAVVKANLHSLGATGQSRLRQSIVRTTNAFPHPSVALSSRSGNIGLGFSPEQAFCGEGPSCLQGTTTEPNSHLRLCGDRMDVESTGCVCDVAGNRATKSCSMCPTLRCTSYQEQLPSKSYETSEATFSSGGSGVSIVQGAKPGTNSMKRKLTSEDAECPGEDAEDESVDVKKSSSGRSNVTKRSRAAEVHNLSERRRRDRINEKMRALQDLIPYSNKTDKASMLDEAIEYLKMLQLQLKMMSMRSGITLPAMLLPPGSPPSRTHLAALDQGGSMESVKHASFRCGLGQTAPGQRLVPTLCGPSNVLPGSTADSQLHFIPLGVDALNVYHTSNARSDVQEQSLDQIQYQQ